MSRDQANPAATPSTSDPATSKANPPTNPSKSEPCDRERFSKAPTVSTASTRQSNSPPAE